MEMLFRGRYRLDEWLMAGKTGELYAGKDLSLERPVFVFLARSGRLGAGDEYLRRVSAVAGFSHPGFLHILDCGMEEGKVYIVMQAVPGRPLSERLVKGRPGLPETVKIVFEAAQALKEAAEQQVANVRVGVDNLWFSQQGGVKFIDYWSPEESNHRGAAGVVSLFYRLLTGKTFDADHPDAALRELQTYAEKYDPLVFHTLERVVRPYASTYSLPTIVENLGHLHWYFTQRADRKVPQEGEGDARPFPAQAASLSGRARGEEEEEGSFVRGEREGIRKRVQSLISLGKGRKLLLPLRVKWRKAGKRARRRVAVFSLLLLAVLVLRSWLGGGEENEGAGPHGEKNAAPVSGSLQEEAPSPAAEGSGKPSDEERTAEDGFAGEQGLRHYPEEINSETAESAERQQEDRGSGEESGEVTVPDLRGMTLEQAEQALLSSRLRYQYFLERAEAPEGVVYKQDIPAGSRVKTGSRVTFWVSKGM
ncbi:hypothetical protein BSNK01_16870 [Bacillaceae bacterium]